jgi:hypothetical protein
LSGHFSLGELNQSRPVLAFPQQQPGQPPSQVKAFRGFKLVVGVPDPPRQVLD